MLSTLLKIGEWQSQGKGEWDQFLEPPKIELTDNSGNAITNYVLPVIFDLDEKIFKADKENLREYRESDVEEKKVLKIQGGNNKSIYASVHGPKILQLYKTFFGKENLSKPESELKEALKKEKDENLTPRFERILDEILYQKDDFLKDFTYVDEKNQRRSINVKAIEKMFGLSRNERIVLIYAEVKASEFGLITPTDFAKVPEYDQFLRNKFIGKNSSKDEEAHETKLSTCYASGKMLDDVQELDLPRNGYSLNAMFVTTTRNFASGFDDKKFKSNYQLSKKNQEYLSFASKFLLEKYKVKIANIDHVIIPIFQDSDKIDLSQALNTIKRKSDLLFAFDTLEEMTNSIEDETDWTYWVNFIAFESDGNFFKSTESIKDVSKFHFQKVLKDFDTVHKDFKSFDFVDWGDMMSEYGKKGRFFNFNSVYGLIPVRKDKDKKNRALDLLKAILEKRPINKVILFDYFKDLVLCHYYERYNSYTNVPKSSKDYFKRSIKASVFKYLALIRVLEQLNLIKMEQHQPEEKPEIENLYEKSIQDFFEKMNLSPAQKAMFYLGRMLNTVEWIQVQKKIKKTVINLVNFNGMEKTDIVRLRENLVNKARQHNKVGKVIFNDGKFGELFDYNHWTLSRNEALFFLLTGYSFGTKGTDAENREQQELENEEI
jgi:CRISPR-associated protein Csh1